MLKPKKCTICTDEFSPRNSLQKVCSLPCAVKHAEQKRKKVYDQETRRMKRELNDNDRRYQLKKAQEDFNRYIRYRDRDKPCISCGKPLKKSASGFGSPVDAGHYRTSGAHPELRYHEANCHAQCVACNRHQSANLADYRIELVKRVGQRMVDFLEGPHQSQNWTLDDIKEIRRYYKDKLKQLEE